MTPAPLRVFVYKNLHQSRKNGQPWYSIQALEGDFKGRVIHRSGNVLLANAKGVVRKAGRERVLREGRKNVHAGMVGELISILPRDFVGTEITYNPYKYETFVHRNTELPFEGTWHHVYIDESGIRAA
ncbi:hypothetical protein SEA_DARTHPHADER_81 [Mycobacterium phage DarthPhader]|uniref:Uncharacterized protein n=1 Tax=Mycobacterium phage DarthPhader TaxID=1912975 RepID=A0A1I9S427_9CAUD|nr:hypothetical protein KIV60_gp20 [Mycobacterium phage DarthPhader]AOZ61321.1 hypothetical protein SEA_DARTHPHADER_81 [Mycobacterium phage DarthPhader]